MSSWDYGMTAETKRIRQARAAAWNRTHRDALNARIRHATPDQRARRNAKAALWQASRPWYSSWQAARQRCTNPKHKNWLRYGGRGIIFGLSKADMAAIWERDWTPEMETPTLDRIDNDGPYSLDNCRLLSLRDNLRRKAGMHWTPAQREAASRGRKARTANHLSA